MSRRIMLVKRERRFLLAVVLLFVLLPEASRGGDWSGQKAQWHGYDQFHFQVEGRAAYVVVPREVAPGRPWVWRARFPDYHADMDITLLGKGFHIAYLNVAGLYGCPQAVEAGNEFYDLLTGKHSLAPRPVLEGVSRGGLFVYNWAARNLDKVCCIYCDTPVMDIGSWPGGKGKGIGSAPSWDECLKAYGMTEEQALNDRDKPIDQAVNIVKAGIPILHVVSESDQVVPPDENTYVARGRVPERLLRNFRVIKVPQGTEKSHGHHFQHPNPAAVVSFIVKHAIFEGGYISTTDSRSLDQIETVYKTIPPLDYVAPADRCRLLPRTMKLLREGPEMRVVMLGDSIINDTSRSGWNLLLDRACPNCKVTKITSVRGSTGCWWYKDNDRVRLYVIDQRPDLVIIGGISQRDDVESIGQVIDQIRAAGSAEILVMSGAFGRVDPTDDAAWDQILKPQEGDYRSLLQRLATDQKVEFLDMRKPWAEYIRQSGKELDWFKRDVVHANERGEQVIGRILFRYLTPTRE